MARTLRLWAGVLMLALVLVACDGSSSPSGAFDFVEDDLCEWITPDTVSEIVADAYERNGASPIPVDFEQSWTPNATAGCAWSVGEPGRDDAPYAETGLIRTELRSDDTQRTFKPHAALSAGVQVGPRAEYIGAYGEFVPGMEVRLLVEGQDYTVEFWHGVLPGFDGDANTVLAIADGLLREMGWLPDQRG